MSNTEQSENKNQTQTKKFKHPRPVPKVMSMTWLRLHMREVIIAVVATFILSLFFIGYGTNVDRRAREKREEDYKNTVTKEAQERYSLPEKLKDKANEPVVTLSLINNPNASSTIDVKTFFHALSDEKNNIMHDNRMSNEMKNLYLTIGLKRIKEDVLNELIRLNAVNLYAKAYNIVSADSIKSAIEKRIDAERQQDRQFDVELARNGLTLDQFIQSKVEQGIFSTVCDGFIRMNRVYPASATEDTFKSYYEKNKLLFKKDDKISFEHLLVSPADLKETLSVDDNQIANYYEANKTSYMSSKQVEALHIFIKTDKESLANMPYNEADILDKYNKQKEIRFTEPEQVKASHILITPRGEGSEEEKFEEAKKVIQELYEKAKNGEDFAQLAKDNSEDPGSASNGGDLGFFERGAMVKEFEEAAFSSEIGSITEPVKTAYGYHIIKVEDKKAQTVKPYEEVKETLVGEVRTDLANASAASNLNEVRNSYLAIQNKDMAENFFKEKVKEFSKGKSAENQGLLPLFAKGEIVGTNAELLKDEIGDGNDSVAYEIEEKIFAMDTENSQFPRISEVIRTQNGYHLFLVKGFKEPAQLPLTDNIKNSIKNILISKLADSEAEKIANKLFAENSSASIEELVKAYGKSPSESMHSFKDIGFSNSLGSNVENLDDGSGLFTENGMNYVLDFQKALIKGIKEQKLNVYLQPFKTQFGWNIVKITDYKTNFFEPYENVRDSIRRMVTFTPSDAEVNQFYEANKASFDKPATRVLRQIVVGDKSIADTVYKELCNGVSFTLLAKTYSNDSSAANGGLTSPIVKGKFAKSAPNYEEAIWNLEKGKYSEPISTPFGYIIAMLESETQEEKSTLDANRTSQIKNALGKNYEQEAKGYFVVGVMNQTNVDRNQELIDLVE